MSTTSQVRKLDILLHFIYLKLVFVTDAKCGLIAYIFNILAVLLNCISIFYGHGTLILTCPPTTSPLLYLSMAETYMLCVINRPKTLNVGEKKTYQL